MNRGQRRAQWSRSRKQADSLASETTASSLRPRVNARSSPREHTSTPVRVTIEELALNGFGRASAHGIAAGFERKLTALLNARGLPEAWIEGASAGEVRAEAIRVRVGARDQAVGEQIAEALFEFHIANRR